MENLITAVEAAIQKLFNTTARVVLERPDEQFGDYATNVALQLAKPLGKNPREIGEALAAELREQLVGQVREITVAGPGFINIKLSDALLGQMAATASAFRPNTYQNEVVVAEYSDPNPFKVLHAGHLYTSVTGDALANLYELGGAQVHRVNFGGDVGLHVGKTLWAILADESGHNQEASEELALAHIKLMQKDAPAVKARWMASMYVIGNNAYDDNPEAKNEIVELNKRVYQIHNDNDKTSNLAQIYWTCREWSYDYFKSFYDRIEIKPFEKFYPESETAPIGIKTVLEQLDNVYKKSDGAVVFRGEAFGLHTRVFINSQGLPTYETKDVGLIMKKWDDYHFDRSVVITGNDIIEYMKVVLKSIEQFQPDLVARTTHLTHGQVKLIGGVKMSSRKGNILLADDILAVATAEALALGDNNNDNHSIALAAVKYAFLKQRMGDDIIYDPKESVSLEGNSGPYLQYAHARARSILRKSTQTPAALADLQPAERSLARKISEYPEVVTRAAVGLMPHHICTYLYELAQSFNRFYEHNRVVGDEREAMRLQLVNLYAHTLKAGLQVLGITAPEQM